MPELGKITTVLTGFQGGPGYSTMYFFGDPYSTSTAQDNVNHVAAFWNGMVTSMPGGTHFSVQPDVQVIDEATGALLRVESTIPDSQTGNGPSGGYAAGVGFSVAWQTPAVHDGKTLRGRTFVVPLSGGNYDTSGTIVDSYLAVFRTVASDLAAVSNFGVWGRPKAGVGGLWSKATGATVRDQVSWLTTRRR